MRLLGLLLSLSLAAALTCAVSVSDVPSVNNPQSYPSMKLAQTLSAQGLENPNGQFRVGIQTRKNVETPEPLRRSDCEINDECEDYSGLPQSRPRKITTKNFRKPFFGLSITTPLQ
jgi:hypothetical protein